MVKISNSFNLMVISSAESENWILKTQTTLMRIFHKFARVLLWHLRQVLTWVFYCWLCRLLLRLEQQLLMPFSVVKRGVTFSWLQELMSTRAKLLASIKGPVIWHWMLARERLQPMCGQTRKLQVSSLISLCSNLTFLIACITLRAC